MQANSDRTRPAIIAASDGTPRSAHVIGRSAALAALCGMRLVVAHVEGDRSGKAERRASPESEPRALGRLGRKLAARAPALATGKRRLDAIAEAMRDAGLHEAPRLLQGDPAGAISTLAEEEGAALLVLGLHGERRVLDALRLTTMERIVLATKTPALIAHQPPRRDYAQVLALTDFSPASAAALALAARLAPKARFHALHMLTLPLGARFTPDDPACDAAITQAEQAREGFLATPGLPALAEPPLMVPGNLHELLKLRSEEINADLICIGINSGRDGGRLGHYARDLMRAPPLDLLIARAA